MSVESGQSIAVDFTTQSPATGAATDATGTPTGTIVVNGTDNGASVTVTNKGTGYYKAGVTLPALSAGDRVQLRIAATVSGVSALAYVWGDYCEVRQSGDSFARIGSAGAGLTSVGLASGAITAAVVATGAIDADALAADAVAEIADGVWDEALSGHAAAGSAGAALSTAGAAADPLTSSVPGSYNSGTAGYALGRIGTTAVTISIADHLQAGNLISIVRGDSYHASDGNSITFTFTESRAGLSWNGDTVTLHVRDVAGNTASWPATCSQSGTTVTVTVGNLTGSQTDDLVEGAHGTWQLRGEPGASGRPITAVEGTLAVKASLAV